MKSSQPDTDTTHARPALDALFLCFSILWVLAALFHTLKRADLVATPVSLAFSASALFFLLDPRSVHRFVLAALCHGALFLSHTPDAGNHEFFAFWCEVAFVVVYVVMAVRDRRAIDGSRWILVVAPAMRWATVVLYFFAVFHKLNSSYFSPESCGADLPIGYLTDHVLTRHLHLDSFLPVTSSAAAWFFVGSSLALEIAIPILLVIRRTAHWGFLAGFVLHFFLGVFYFWHFTPMLYCLFVLFLPLGFHRWVVQAWHRLKSIRVWESPSLDVQQAIRRVLLFTLLLLPLLYVLAPEVEWLRLQLGAYNRGHERLAFVPVLSIAFGWVPFVVLSLTLAACVLRFARRRGGGSRGAMPARLRLDPVVAWLPVLLVLNGLTPYLGLKTHQSFSMFSNLWTEGGETNHLFMPMLEVTDWTRDVVWPIHPTERTEDGGRVIVDSGYVYADLRDVMHRRIARGETDVRISFLRGGRAYDLENAEQVPEFATPRPWLMRKFVSFRRIATPENRDVCAY